MNRTEEIYDKKLEYLTEEIMSFHQFMLELGNDFSNKRSQLNIILLTEKIMHFYEKYKKKYNKTQLVYQFLKITYKDDKDILNLYNTFQKVQKEKSK